MKKQMTITEALAEIRTLEKRVNAKRDVVNANYARFSVQVDPHEGNGGSVKLCAEAMQGAGDLEKRRVDIRSAIQKSNLKTKLEIAGVTMSVAEWLVWRREVADSRLRFFRNIAANIYQARKDAVAKSNEQMEMDLIVHVDEQNIRDEVERIETTLGDLDGQLTLLNSTTFISV